jgi:DNA segregation ATPase FtsK/SpoIIIE, S-DNA-T family
LSPVDGGALIARPWSDRQRDALRALRQAVAERSRREVDMAREYRNHSEATEQQFVGSKQRIEAALAQAQGEALMRGAQAGQEVQTRYEQEKEAALNDFRHDKHQISRLYYQTKDVLQKDFEESRWTTGTLYEADRKTAKDQQQAQQRACRTLVAKLEQQQQAVQELAARWAFLGPLPEVRAEYPHAKDPWEALQHCAEQGAADMAAVQELRSPPYLQGPRPWLLVLVLWISASLPAFFFPWWYYWLAAACVAPVAAYGAIVRARRKVRSFVAERWMSLCESAQSAKALQARCSDEARQSYKGRRAQSKRRTQTLLQELAARSREKLAELRGERAAKLRAAEQQCRKRLAQNERTRAKDHQAVETSYSEAEARAKSQHDEEMASAKQALVTARDELSRRHAQVWVELLRFWKEACDRFLATSNEIARACGRCFPDWHDDFRPAETLPWGLPFGRLQLAVEMMPGGQPSDPQLPRLDLAQVSFPALLPFPERASFLIKASDEGKAAALGALEALLLRCWTALPPGKVRCTVIDPVGRGESFGAFMHLADHDESFVTGRIWTEPAQITHRLADLTAHMENVLQKYLRNQFQSLAEYNAQAGEIAEPFRFLVVAGFPVNFGDDAARRLLSLASAGARCGVYTFILLDTKQPLPDNFDLTELERACTCVTWEQGRFVWDDEDYEDLPLELAQPPGADRCTELLRQAGAAAKKAARVEVPFENLVPPREEWWQEETRTGLNVPLGRVGARAFQMLQLGHGTSQHVLVAGKTGSGKSTLLHVLITQLALRYSPREVEMYLVDFKKGVEFKSYAAYGLPHARVVAVESEREFGLSVLQRLDLELSRRGELYRTHGATDLAGYREAQDRAAAAGAELPVLPRVVLIVDEFQEFFVEDDKVAQESALLLDRLVRQGRAFGVHIILGSQTLGGAYSLARSTIDQMAVRIALQCSETDAHLILSRENNEAKLLSRPGEAIYNAAHGLLEGNHLFQIVWLTDTRRDEYLAQLRDMGRQREEVYAPIVFEGNAPAELPQNLLLARLLTDVPAANKPWQAWLGAAVAIKDPTAAVFRRQSGSNLLLLGQHEDTAFGLVTATLVSLAARAYDAAEAPLHLVIAAALDPSCEPLVPALCEALPIHLVQQRELPELLTQLTAEAERRTQGGVGATPLFLCLYGLQRLRDLRRPEDDFGFSRRGEEKPSPYRQFLTLLRDGPPVGIHTILWCDTLTNLNRSLDRQTLREFDLRVLMQMSVADSSALIDSPIAAKLGPNRALFYTEEQGKTEKFRPYSLPTPEWLRGMMRHRPAPRPVQAAAEP